MLIRFYFVVCSFGVELVDCDVMNKFLWNVKNLMIIKILIMNVFFFVSLIVIGILWVFWREVWF